MARPPDLPIWAFPQLAPERGDSLRTDPTVLTRCAALEEHY